MTYQVLEVASPTALSTSDSAPPVGIGTDYAEYELWKSQHPDIDEQLVQDELAELGISLDDHQ